MIRLRYDGRYNWIEGESRQWTLLSHYIAPDGADYYHSSRMLQGLKELGIIKEAA